MQFKEHFVIVNNVKTFYLEAGEGTPLLFIHGWGARSYSYKDALTILAIKYHVYAIDLPGFGRSATPPEMWNFAEYAKYTSAFITIVCKAKVILVGHSLGGGVALYTASQSKDIAELVLLDAAGVPFERGRIILYTLFMLRLFQEMLHPKYWIKSLDLSINFLFNASHFSFLVPFTQKIFKKQIASDNTVFKNINVKTLILWGRKDTIFGEGIEKKMNKAISHSRLEYINGTHNWIIFTPEYISKYV
ncbi:lipase EstV [soil metagenome]